MWGEITPSKSLFPQQFEVCTTKTVLSDMRDSHFHPDVTGFWIYRACRLIGQNRPLGWLRVVRAMKSRLIFRAGVKWSYLQIDRPAFPPFRMDRLALGGHEEDFEARQDVRQHQRREPEIPTVSLGVSLFPSLLLSLSLSLSLSHALTLSLALSERKSRAVSP